MWEGRRSPPEAAAAMRRQAVQEQRIGYPHDMAPDVPRVGSKLSVLVIADHPDMRELLDGVLTDAEFGVALLADPAHAIERIRNALFNLVILDLATLRVDELTLVRQIHEVNDDMEIIAITTVPREADTAPVVRRGSDRVYRPTTVYVDHPVTHSKILDAIVRIAMRRPLTSVAPRSFTEDRRAVASVAAATRTASEAIAAERATRS